MHNLDTVVIQKNTRVKVSPACSVFPTVCLQLSSPFFLKHADFILCVSSGSFRIVNGILCVVNKTFLFMCFLCMCVVSKYMYHLIFCSHIYCEAAFVCRSVAMMVLC